FFQAYFAQALNISGIQPGQLRVSESPSDAPSNDVTPAASASATSSSVTPGHSANAVPQATTPRHGDASKGTKHLPAMRSAALSIARNRGARARLKD
ncbi:hypothetical protein CF319_g5294, partial [Tilletia indica]